MIWLSLAWAQDDDFDDFSLEELVDVELVDVVARKPEPLFEAPVAVSVLQAEDIRRSGVVSLAEALRLVPGVLVREQAPGVFDVHLRGLDDVGVDVLYPYPRTTTLLVMIDYQVVYSYFGGGVNWEVLPVELHDIARIEVIRGPTAAHYGPNAVTGAINIVTRGSEDPAGDTVIAVASTDQFAEGLRAGVSYGRRGDAGGMRVSAHGERRLRDTSAGLRRAGGTVAGDTTFGKDGSFRASAGAEVARADKIGPDDGGDDVFTPQPSFTTYLNSELSVAGLYVQGTGRGGARDESPAALDHSYFSGDLLMRYPFAIAWLGIEPRLSTRLGQYRADLLGGSDTLQQFAGSFIFDARPVDPLRILLGGRLETYDAIAGTYPSRQLTASYTFSLNTMVRAGIFGSRRSPAMLDVFADGRIRRDEQLVRFLGSSAVPVLDTLSVEAGFRQKVGTVLTVDVEGFRSQTEGISDYLFEQTQGDVVVLRKQAQPYEAEQLGVTGAVEVKGGPARVRLHGTGQRTQLSFAGPDPTGTPRVSTTPTVYGGTSVAVTGGIVESDTMLYATSNQRFVGAARDRIGANAVLHQRFGVRPRPDLSVWLAGRDLLGWGSDARQYGRADVIGPSVWLGIRYDTSLDAD